MRIYPAWAGRKRGTDLVIKTNIIFDCYPLKYPITRGKYQIISGKYKGISENIKHIDKYQHIIEISEHACSKRLKFCSIYQNISNDYRALTFYCNGDKLSQAKGPQRIQTY